MSSARLTDYALDAILLRGATAHRGWRAIADYFDGAVERLLGRQLAFNSIEAIGHDRAAVRWRVDVDGDVMASGRDDFVTDGGFIVSQTVVLDHADF